VLSLVGMYPDCEVISTDVCVPISRLAGLMEGYKIDQERINEGIQGVGLRSLVMGHVGDGNFHSLMYEAPFFSVRLACFFVVCRLTTSAFEKGNVEMKKKAQELETLLVMNALALDGTCSGEHGIGIHKLVPVPIPPSPSLFLQPAAPLPPVTPTNTRTLCAQNTIQQP
jgi:D-lactate dehydrogenase (cytochrome)